MSKNISGFFIMIFIFQLIVCVVIPKLSFGQDYDSNINIGEIIEVNSEILQESRNIFIYTPAGYEESNMKYPTLYVTDGVENYLISTVELMKILARACGHSSLSKFNLNDLTTFSEKMAKLSGVQFGGVGG